MILDHLKMLFQFCQIYYCLNLETCSLLTVLITVFTKYIMFDDTDALLICHVQCDFLKIMAIHFTF